MEEFIELDRVIDNRNRTLWNELSEHFEIEIILHDKPYAELFSKSGLAHIFVNEDVDVSSFTHELLHLWIEQREVYVQSTLRLSVQNNPTLSKIFCNELIVHFGNVCEHVKMYPLFVAMDFDSSDFLHDNNVHKCEERILRNLEKRYRFLWTYRAKAIDLFIGKFMAIHADHNTELDYSNCKNRLSKLDKKLYTILNDFWNNWLDYDLTQEDGIYISYHQIVTDFLEQLENYVNRKVLI